MNKLRPGQITRPMPIEGARVCKTTEACPIFLARTFCYVKKSQSDQQISSQIDKTLKKLH